MSQQWKLGKTATRVVRNSDGLRVTYHSTDVVTVHANGTITLDTGGWWTNTTKSRMNQAANQFGLGFSVHQDQHIWYVTVGPVLKTLSQFRFDSHSVTFNPKTGRRIKK
jgi:hypothetical protein